MRCNNLIGQILNKQLSLANILNKQFSLVVEFVVYNPYFQLVNKKRTLRTWHYDWLKLKQQSPHRSNVRKLTEALPQ